MRLLIVSNRLPINVEVKDGKPSFKQSAGGLVSGLSAYLDLIKGSTSTCTEYIWVGWPGITVSDDLKEEVKVKVLKDYHAHPVFLSEEAMDKFYHGFCNKMIWPLFHYFPSYTVYQEEYWDQYKQVNEIFCDAVLEVLKPGDVIWIQDYHLMLLPQLIRERAPEVQIGFFLHIPFPSFEIFRLIPRAWGREILEGLLGADLIGFHTHDYTQYFLKCVFRILGYELNMGRIMKENHRIKVETFPMGIDFRKFYQGVGSPEVQKHKDELKEGLSGYKVVLSVDRLDYSKGIINRLQGYEVFLERNPQWQGKVILLLLVVPSRIGVEHYQQMKKQIDERAGEINGRFGSVHWTPILYQYRFFSIDPLLALYSVSDVALITPLRDGMNLVAKEYVATRVDQTGVLILSEMAGAAKELGEALIINPNHIEEIADALKQALEMSTEEQIKRNQSMQERLRNYDVIRWSDEFIKQLLSSKDEPLWLKGKSLESHLETLLEDYKKSRHRLILLDYDGTLVPFAKEPQMAKPAERLLTILRSFGKEPKTEVAVISGRDRETLESWLGSIPLHLVGEHGAWIKEKGDPWRLLKALVNDWKPQILQLIQRYTDRLPGSMVEEKEFGIAWHYRNADPEFALILAQELIDDLMYFTANIDIQVLQGNKVIEVRHAGINKGDAALHWMGKGDYDFILAIGDDRTDEDLFSVLPPTAYSIRVGMAPSQARFNLQSHVKVLELLEQLLQ
ncbi:MAG: bifunctional alpha,alpha-trehalose-phosphate synthase (UDP-forming)/trehalose-phosphatase [Desulfitobacteriaceae bacterium]